MLVLGIVFFLFFVSFLCIGLSHQNSALELRERVAVSKGQLDEVLADLHSYDGVEEVVLLSTCNRTEIYLAGEIALLVKAGEAFFCQRGQIEKQDLFLYQYQDKQAAVHLCRVAGGLESMVLGETEILGQIKQAYQFAHQQGTTAAKLNRLFQQSFRIAKKIRTHTAIQRGATSVAAVAVELAERIFGELDHCRTMVLGAGETSRQMAKAMASRGVKSLIVSNRNRDRAEELAGEIGGNALSFHDWQKQLKDTDILLAATGAPHKLIFREELAPLVSCRKRPLFLIDIAVPRDVEPSVNELEEVYLYDMDAIESLVAENRGARQEQIQRCEQLIEQELLVRPVW